MKKYEGRFLRLMGEVQARRGEFDQARASLNEAIRMPRRGGNLQGSLAGPWRLASYERMGRGSGGSGTSGVKRLR